MEVKRPRAGRWVSSNGGPWCCSTGPVPCTLVSTPTPHTQAGLPGDRPLHAKRRLAIFGSGVAAYLLFRLLASFPEVTEALVAPIHPPIAWTLSRLTGLFPFSVAEFALVVYVGAWVTFVVRAVSSVVFPQVRRTARIR